MALQRHVAFLAAMVLTSLAAPTSAASGRVRLLTYNVAGLPDGVMTSHPSRNMSRIGELLNGYDLVFVQEDFAYAAELRATVRLPHASAPFVRKGRLDFGDGLSQFAREAFDGIEREAWRECHGLVDSYFDCLTPKGFTFARQHLANGVTVDTYNLHMDAGGNAGDEKAREAQIEQLIEGIRARSPASALIVAGDTNVPQRQRALLERLERETGLTDICAALHCGESRRIDRVFYRSSTNLRLTPRRYGIDRRFVDASKRPLSDHLAVAVELDWLSTP